MADDVGELIFLAEGFPQLSIFVAQFTDFEGFFDNDGKVVERKRLGNEIDRAFFHRLDGVFNGAERGHHDDGRVRVLATQFFDEGEAVHAGKFEVGEDEVDIGGEFESVLGGRGGFDFVAGGGKMEPDDPAVFFFVLNNEDGWTRHLFYCGAVR